MHRCAVAAPVERQCRHYQRVRPEKVEIVRPKSVTEHGLGRLVQHDEVASALDVLHRRMHQRAAVPIVAAREELGADDHEIEPTLELQRNGIVGADLGDVVGVDGERIDHREIVVAKV